MTTTHSTTQTTPTTTDTTAHMDADAIADALDQSVTKYLPADEIEVVYGAFPDSFQRGIQIRCTMADWAAHREDCAADPWPRAPGQPNAKKYLPSEVGAVLRVAVDSEDDGEDEEDGGDVGVSESIADPPPADPSNEPRVRRRARDVLGFTWIFIDSDAGVAAHQLRHKLHAMNIAHLMTESATSRLVRDEGEQPQPKWHLFLPLGNQRLNRAEMTALPSRNPNIVDVPATIAATATWWQRVHDHVAAMLFRLGDIRGETGDRTAGSFPRMAYVPHSPDGSPRKIGWSEGRLLDLVEFLRRTGFQGGLQAPKVLKPEYRPSDDCDSDAPQPSRFDFRGEDGDRDDDPDGARVSDELTAGETTGSLLRFALNWFGYLGRRKPSDPHAYYTLCPWRRFHSDKSDEGGHDPDRHDDSVVAYLSGPRSLGYAGGFKCMHDGSGNDGECARATAADVLRWARREGCPLPDRAEWGGSGSGGESGHGGSDVGAVESSVGNDTTPSALPPTPDSAVDQDQNLAHAHAPACAESSDRGAPNTLATPHPENASCAILGASVNASVAEHAGGNETGGDVGVNGVVTKPTPTPAPTAPSQPTFPLAPPQAARPPTPQPHITRRRLPEAEKVVVTVREDALDEARDLAIAAVSRHPKFYRIGGGLVDVVFPDPEDINEARKPWVRKTAAPDLLVELCAVSKWVTPRVDRRGNVVETPQKPDGLVVKAVLAAGYFPHVRELAGVVSTPMFHRLATSPPDGRLPDAALLQQQGHDKSTGLIYWPGVQMPPISPDPSRGDCSAALKHLRSLFSDFDPVWACDPALAFGVVLSGVFTRLLRFYLRSASPMLLVGAGDAGSGKTLLGEVICLIADGELPEVLRGYSGDEAETERQLGVAIKKRSPALMFDNIARGQALASPCLEAYMTSPTNFSTRLIGTSDGIVASPWDNPLLLGNGNGLQTGGDIARRCVRIDIDDRTGSPTGRKVKITNLRDHVRQYRRTYLCAALTLLAGYFAAKRRGWRPKLPPFASFQMWDAVREAVVWCGLPDPYLARGKVEDDADAGVFRFLVEHLRGFGVASSPVFLVTIVKALRQDVGAAKPKYGSFNNFLADCGVAVLGGSEHGAATSLGKFLAKYDGKVSLADGRRWRLSTKKKKGRDGRVIEIVDCGAVVEGGEQ